MKRIIFILALLVSPTLFAYSQAAKEEQNLKQIEQELNTAQLKGDASVFEKYFADALISIDPGGAVMSKAENIRALKSGDIKFESSNLYDMKVQLYGNTSVVTYRSVLKGKYKDRNVSGQYRWMDVFTKQRRVGRWLQHKELLLTNQRVSKYIH